MGTCIICGTDTDGHVCSSHEEDAFFEFTGTRPGQLTPGRFYRGSVDGFADFGVFVDVGEHVTGLLHTSELDRRLESLDWQPGDTVFVQVKNVRDNGNVDLGWSIRQHESEFRGHIIDDPDGDRLPESEDADAEGDDPTATERSADGGASAGAEGRTTSQPNSSPDSPVAAGAEMETESESEVESGADTEVEPEPEPESETDPGDADGDVGGSETDRSGTDAGTETGGGDDRLRRTAVADLADDVGAFVRIEGRIVEARQTSGPTVFELRDETGAVECAAFEAAGVRAYPEVEPGDVVRIDGEVEERRGDLQVETESLSILEGEEAAEVEERLESALAERARPEGTDLLASHPAVEAVREGVVQAATAIRRAVFDSRPVVVRHSATVDGYVAGAAIERAVLDLIRKEHEEADAEYHYFDRRPLDGRLYGMDDAMRDATNLLEAGERHGEKVPLFVFVNAGSTEESRDGLDLLSIYGAEAVVVEGDHPDESMADAVGTFVSPHLSMEGVDASTTALAANVAAHVSGGVRDDLAHLPAVSYWHGAPDAYADLAADAGYDADDVSTVREAIALEAFYQAYEAKRELISDLLFERGELAEHASEQFRERVEREVRTARPHVEERDVDGHVVGVLDVSAFTHEYEFPPIELLLGVLAERDDLDTLVGADEDRLLVWSESGIDMRAVGERVAEAVPDGGVETRGGRDGHLVFLSGEREDVLRAALSAVADEL